MSSFPSLCLGFLWFLLCKIPWDHHLSLVSQTGVQSISAGYGNVMFVVSVHEWTDGECYDLWDGMISFPFLKDDLLYCLLKEVIKEALKHLSLLFRESLMVITQILPHPFLQLGTFHWKTDSFQHKHNLECPFVCSFVCFRGVLYWWICWWLLPLWIFFPELWAHFFCLCILINPFPTTTFHNRFENLVQVRKVVFLQFRKNCVAQNAVYNVKSCTDIIYQF